MDLYQRRLMEISAFSLRDNLSDPRQFNHFCRPDDNEVPREDLFILGRKICNNFSRISIFHIENRQYAT